MAKFCIMRTKKLKTDGNVSSCISHHLRTRNTSNADYSKLQKNWYYPNNYDIDRAKSSNNDIEKRQEWQRKSIANYKKRLPEKVRKNGVRAIEFMITYSPEVDRIAGFDKFEYFNRSIKWLKNKFGEENLVFMAVHLDETTPHLSAIVVPIDEKGKLNCRSYLGGREKMSALQDEFYEFCGKPFGLERGKKGSKAKHQTIKQYYEKINNISSDIEKIPEKSLRATLKQAALALANAEEYKNIAKFYNGLSADELRQLAAEIDHSNAVKARRASQKAKSKDNSIER
ncbi:MobV family relaxase [Treponema pedis]|uniref:MobV family relaxase n=1 Tax=Treponema pedis TaxID=409322 RepID=UPI003140D051